MANAARGLGRGYDALISTTLPGSPAAGQAAAPGPPREAPLDLIDPSPWQPRSTFDGEELRALADSIAEQGLLVPLGVRARGGRYELVHGERRLRALRLLGRASAPVTLLDMADARVREAALVENLQRADLDPIETALAYQALLIEHGYTQETMANRLGISRQRVGNSLRLLNLPEEARRMVADGRLSAGQAKALMALPEADAQLRLARRASREDLPVREIERLAGGARTDARSVGRRGKGGRKAGPDAEPDAARQAAVRDFAERLSRHLGTAVEVRDAGEGGRIVIPYHSSAEADRLARRMGMEPDG